MDSNINKTQDQQDFERAVGTLPESLQRFCLSGRSVQNLAHLIKNVLQITSGSVEVMELGLKRKQYDRVEKSWGLFETNFVRMKKFVLDLVKYTKHYSLQKAEHNLNLCIDNAIRSCDFGLKSSAVKIQLQKDKTIPQALLDPDRIEEMIANLITHALDNLPEHAGTISIATKYLVEHNQIQISVSDDGPGLSDETIRSLEEPHERTHNMIGTGFDIPLATIFIEQHNGYMEFESSEPKGNCVHVYLPIEKND